MLYKLVFLTLLFIVNVNKISADNTNTYQLSRHLLTDDGEAGTDTSLPDDQGGDTPDDAGLDALDDQGGDTPDDIDTPDENDVDNENDDENDGTDAPDDGGEDDGEDTETGDADDENDATEGPSAEDFAETTESGDTDTESEDISLDTESTESNDDISLETVGSADDSSIDDICDDLTETICGTEADEIGEVLCAFNRQTGECYPVTRQDGRFGSGNYDDGYIAAKSQAEQETGELTTLIGVLGGIIGGLILIILGGGWYFYKEMKKDKHNKIAGIESDGQSVNVDDENMIIDTTNGKDNASDPMLS
jgi:hypothetical protein